MEKRKGYYNKVYIDSDKYKSHYIKVVYYPMWIHVLSLIGNEKIFEGGCGTGQFAQMLMDNGKDYRLGIDYSEVAIEIAKKMNQGNENKFKVYDLFEFEKLKIDYDLFLCLEVLEHIDNDCGLLRKIEKGKRIILSVPDFNDPSHVRVFKNKRKLIKRYGELISIKDIFVHKTPGNNKWFIVHGIKQ